MAFEFKLPDIGEGIDAAEIVEWHVAVGDEVVEDQPLVDVQTDKAIVVMPCPTDGMVLQLPWQDGDMVPVGAVLATFGDPSELAAAQAAAGPPAPEPANVPANGSPPSPAVAGPTAGAAGATAVRVGRPLASPAVRKLARDHGVDLASVVGSGPGARIAREDVLAALEPAAAAAAVEVPSRPSAPVAARDVGGAREDEVVALRGTRRLIARSMTEAWQSIPHIIDFREVDATALIATRAALKARAERAGDSESARFLTMMPLLAKIAAAAARHHPSVNASIDMEREEITLHGAIHLSVAIAAPGGLVTPVVRDADRKTLVEIGSEIAELAAAGRDRRLTVAQLTGGTMMLNNYGALGSTVSTPIIAPGQVINLGLGKLEDRPIVRDGEIVAARTLRISCSGDHRVLDGEQLAAYVNDVVALIEDPVLLLGELA